MDESQCASIPAFRGSMMGGCVDGADIVIVAWKPSDVELAQMAAGNPIYLGFMSGMPPHFVTTEIPALIPR